MAKPKGNITLDKSEELGRGSYGKVYKGTWIPENSSTKLTVAVKRILIEHIDPNTQEVDVVLKLNHPNVVKFIGESSDDDFRYYAFELCNASLKEVYLPKEHPKKYKGPLPPKQNILCQLAEGLKHIHGKQVFHRDLKPANVLIQIGTEPDRNGELDVRFKWGDFGLSKIVKDGSFSLSGIKGTNKWFAPEIINAIPNLIEGCHFDKSSDIFAAGLVYAYILLDGVHPFGKEEIEIKNNLRTMNAVNMPNAIGGNCSGFWEVIKKQLNKEPSDRGNAEEIANNFKDALSKLTSSITLEDRKNNKENRHLRVILDWNMDDIQQVTGFVVRYRAINHARSRWQSVRCGPSKTDANKFYYTFEEELQRNGSYEFQVLSLTLGGISTFCQVGAKVEVGVSLDSICSAPTCLRIELLCQTAVHLAWNHNATLGDNLTQDADPLYLNGYSVEYWEEEKMGSTFMERWTTDKMVVVELLSLIDTTYCVQVKAGCTDEQGSKFYSPPTPVVRIKTCERISELLINGTPSVYSLNVKKRDLGEFRWFDVFQPYLSTGISARETTLIKTNDVSRKLQHPHRHPQHKVIILVGTVGSGKSTLINGMVNYMLGVQWKDPHRFTVIQSEPGASAKQSLSQTKTVTAYTLQHQHGMVVPYSVTIVDTPGYGDTGGVDVDKVITRNIHEFLSNRFHPIAEVHAVCFVAVSGESRLTVTQRYILDWVLSSFGSDVKNNIRLLVTFADNADPPVADACRSANFPMPPHSDDLPFSKFNSSVLFANNSYGDDDDNFDKLFWDMGQENFKKFFDLLEDVKGCGLASTRQVIERCNALEPMISSIQDDLEDRLSCIENAELFVKKYTEHVQRGSMLGSNASNYFEVEFTETKRERIAAENGVIFKNCKACGKTCAQMTSGVPTPWRACGLCQCDRSQHVNEQFEYRQRHDTRRMSLTQVLEYYNAELGSDRNANRLLGKCPELAKRIKREVLRLLKEACDDERLSSSALRANKLTVTDCLYMMSSRVALEDENNVTRLDTFASLQQMLADQENN